MTDSLSFPLGRHVAKATYSAAERAELIDRLASHPAELAAVLSGLPADAYRRPYRPGGWTVQQLVHHVADSHINMFVRVKLALSEHEPTIKPYDQDAWVTQADVEAVSPHVSVALQAAVHDRLVALLRTLAPADFERALMHPENGRMTVEQVLALYAWHGAHHVAHIRNFRQREGV